jgi:hypothetical protein
MDWRYFTGFFDGEGHVGLHPGRRGQKQILLTVSNTHEPTIQAIANFLTSEGVTAGISPHARRKPWKMCYSVHITGWASIRHAAAEMLPFSITKQEALRAIAAYIDGKNWLHWYTTSEVDAALASYRSGLSLREVERVHRISSRTLRGHARRLGIEMRPRRLASQQSMRRRKSGTFIRAIPDVVSPLIDPSVLPT